ncbi:MAG: DUF433 domain-containing protein [Candidatus Magnetobacterium sp. LHC-1]|nr:DUF433 domain-containing protein [Nitrospirota bacterium]
MRERIEINPDIHFGKPCIAATRITLYNVLDLIREDLSFNEIIHDYYPDLQLEDFLVCIQYTEDTHT